MHFSHLYAADEIQDICSQMEPFTWTKLTHSRAFRLLHLHGHDDNGRIICSLEESHIERPQPYMCISYHWGNPKSTTSIVCEGSELAVNAKVHALFSHVLRRDDLEDLPTLKTLWIDAICIDQTDLDERAQQVRLMKEIFSNARATIIYLGEAEKSEDVYPMLELEDKIIEMIEKVAPRRLNKEDLEACGLPPIEDKSWKLWVELFHLPWFNRVWIMQEYILARAISVLYGGHWKPIDYYTTINLALGHREGSYCIESLLRPVVPHPPAKELWQDPNPNEWSVIPMKLPLMDLFRVRRHKEGGHQDWALQMLIMRSLPTEATNPRDYIYGMLGLLPEDVVNHQDLQPDYHAPPEVAYIKLARFVLENKGFATLLESSGLPRQAISTPSWVPDWSRTKVVDTLHKRALLGESGGYGKNDTAPWRLDDGDIPRMLYVRGVVWDEIVGLTSRFAWSQAQGMPTPEAQSKGGFVSDTALLMKRAAKPDESPADLALRHLKTLCLEDPPETGSTTKYLTLSEFVEASKLLAPLYDYKNLKLLHSDQALFEQVFQIRQRVYVSDRFDGFCLTRKGFVGRVAPRTEVKDKICFFQGIDMPFVVHDAGTVRGQYLLGGHCYVEDQMDGKFWARDGHHVEEICLV